MTDPITDGAVEAAARAIAQSAADYWNRGTTWDGRTREEQADFRRHATHALTAAAPHIAAQATAALRALIERWRGEADALWAHMPDDGYARGKDRAADELERAIGEAS